MKTKQLKEIAKEQGYYVRTSNCDIRILIFYKDDILVASISTSKTKDLKIYEPEKTTTELFIALTSYALTPPEKREDKKYFHLRLDAPDASIMPLYYSKKIGIGGTNINVFKALDVSFVFSEEELEKINEQGFVREPVL